MRLFVGGSSKVIDFGAGVVLVCSEGHKLNCVVRYGLKPSNNVAEYEAPQLALDWLGKCK